MEKHLTGTTTLQKPKERPKTTTNARREETSRRHAHHHLTNIPEEAEAGRRSPTRRHLSDDNASIIRSLMKERSKLSPGKPNGFGGHNNTLNRFELRRSATVVDNVDFR
jgi:hypothetical protein